MTSSAPTLTVVGVVAAALLAGTSARAAEPSVLINDENQTTADGAAADQSWIRRHRPRAHDLNLGVFAGTFFTAGGAELRDPDATLGNWNPVAPQLGIRLGYYPLRHFGMEGELAAMPTANDGNSVFVYSARAQGVLQPGFWRVTPFVVLGGGVLGVASDSAALGNETDQALHVGGGVKLFLNDRLHVRLDVRDVISPRVGNTITPAHSPEILATFAVRFGVGPKPPPPPEPPPDKDEDGVPDEEDHCPFDAGLPKYQGCPIPDRDCDDVNDDKDLCPDDPGEPGDGCPIPDKDGDGKLDADDECPTEAGATDNGCPIKDTDDDGIVDHKDQCVSEPENENGFEDLDGCPDEKPEPESEP